MSRFSENRHWTFILALVMCLGGSTLSTSHVAADPSYGTPDDGSQGGGGTGMGDPDVPDGAGRSKLVKVGALSRGAMTNGSRAAGDGRISRSVVVMRLYVAWVGSRSLWFHF